MNEIKISNINPNSIIVNFVEKAIADSKKGNKNLENPWLNFGNIPQNAIDYVKNKFNIDLTGYKYVLEASFGKKVLPSTLCINEKPANDNICGLLVSSAESL